MTTGEKDILLDHSYDGIEEYDNPLPGWWVFIFWATILLAFFYPLYYHFGTGKSVHDEYDLEAAAFFEKQAEQFAGVEVSEVTIYKLMQDPKLITGMKKRFQGKCATCHDKEGQGDACPNLTDDHWLNGGDLVQIYNTILKGVPRTEMKAWVTELGPAGVLTMSAFVGSLRGTHVPGKKKVEGKKYVIKVPDLTGK